MIAGDDPTPWRLLADATIVGVERLEDRDVVAITVEMRALRVRLLLAGCDAVKYAPHDEPVLYELDAIAASQPDLRETAVDHGAIVITGGAGVLRLAYANLAIEAEGAPLDLEGLTSLARRSTR